MSERVFIFSNTALWDLHYAEAVEIALKRKELGDSVYFYQCKGELFGCPANPFRVKAKCRKCIKKSSYVLKNFLSFAKIVTFKKWYELKVPKSISEFVPQTIGELESYYLDEFPIGGLVASQVADEESDGLFHPYLIPQRIAALVDSGYRLFSSAKDFIIENNIDLAYVWNGRRVSDGPVVFAARQQNLEFKTFICGPKIGTYIEPAAISVQATDYQKDALLRLKKSITENEDSCNSVIKSGIDFFANQKLGIHDGLGLYNFGKYFSQKFVALTEMPVLSIFPSCIWEKIGQKEFRNHVYDSEYAGLEKLLNESSITSKFEVIVRWHPNLQNVKGNEKMRIKEIQDRFENKVNFISPTSSISSYSIIDNSEIVLTFGSTVGVEACYYQKKSICIGPAVYDCLEVAHYPNTHTEVIDAILNHSNLETGKYIDAVVFGAFMNDPACQNFEFLTYTERKFMKGNIPLSFSLKRYSGIISLPRAVFQVILRASNLARLALVRIKNLRL